MPMVYPESDQRILLFMTTGKIMTVPVSCWVITDRPV